VLSFFHHTIFFLKNPCGKNSLYEIRVLSLSKISVFTSNFYKIGVLSFFTLRDFLLPITTRMMLSFSSNNSSGVEFYYLTKFVWYKVFLLEFYKNLTFNT
jgi:hypothetical protein